MCECVSNSVCECVRKVCECSVVQGFQYIFCFVVVESKQIFFYDYIRLLAFMT